MSEPKRIQRRRSPGWRLPEGAIYVGRPTAWGNRWRVNEPLGVALDWDAQTVVDLYRAELESHLNDPDFGERNRAKLRAVLGGHDLACWCPLDQPCHADVLLQWANSSTIDATMAGSAPS